MSNLVKHAEAELKLAGLFDKDSDYDGGLGEAVLELVKVFAKQGHSGFSASRTIQLFERVANYKTLKPLTGEDSEWNDVSEMSGEPQWQNNRDSRVFKDKDGKVTALEAIVWRTQKGSTWSGTADGISSKQEIQGFPFTHKTFYVDVTEEEVSPDNWEFHINDRTQLDEVFEHYKAQLTEPNRKD